MEDNENSKLTTTEAMELIALLKSICSNKDIELPHHGQRITFDVKAIQNNKKFIVNINHSNINPDKYTFQSRITSSNIPLLRLDVSPNGVHQNPDGSKIYGTHLHIYNEDFELGNAIEFNIDNPDLYNYCLAFFKKFNILTDGCGIIYQEEFGNVK